MKCTEVEKLLPLYIEGDLADARRVRALGQHIAACDACRHTAEQFSASQALLHGFATPEFPDAFYDSIRREVLAEIRARPRKMSSIFQSARLIFLERPLIASSLALLLLAFGALSFGISRNMTSPFARHLFAVEKGFGEIAPKEFDESAPPKETLGQSVKKRSPATIRVKLYAGSTRGAGRDTQPNASLGGPRRQGFDSPDFDTTSPAASDVPRQDGASAGGGGAAPAQAIARMEIRTSDPNVRIIWLGRRPSE